MLQLTSPRAAVSSGQVTVGRVVVSRAHRKLTSQLGVAFEKRSQQGKVSFRRLASWPNGADLCPDVLIRGGPPPTEASSDKPESALR